MAGGFVTRLKADWLVGEDRLVLEQPLGYQDDVLNMLIVAPSGFYSDGASVPRLVWSLVGHPFEHDVREAAVIHDYLYFSGKYSRAEADRVLRHAMAALGATWYKRWAYWSGVRMGGWIPWNNYRKKKGEENG